MHIPKTKDNYDALNHLLMRVFWEACSTYPPTPNNALPTSIIANIFLNPPTANTVCPRTQIKAVRTNTSLGPFLSIKIPPKRGITIFGKE